MALALPRLRRPMVASLLLTLAAGCGAAGGSYRQDVYSDDETRFHLPEPAGAGWERLEVEEEQNDLAWADDASIIQVNSSCDPALDIPLRALTNHLMIGFTDREFVSQEEVPFAEREALRTHVRAKLDGVPREMLFVVLKKNECVYDFALVSPLGAPFERSRPTFEAMLRGFETR